MVRQVAAGAVSGEEEFSKIGILRPEPDAIPVLVDESQDVESVVVLGGELVLESEPVVDGQIDGVESTNEAAADLVIVRGSGAEEGEFASVEEYDDREGGGGGGGGAGGVCWEEESEPKVSRRIYNDIMGLDAGFWVGFGRDRAIDEGKEAAVDGAVGAESTVTDEVEDCEPEP
ncbi:hypothetical protein Dimus_020431, partial [Dionaea muscipula]